MSCRNVVNNLLPRRAARACLLGYRNLAAKTWGVPVRSKIRGATTTIYAPRNITIDRIR